jgi:hypothetical protein
MQELIPDIEENIPLPSSIEEALPELSPVEELNMRARTIKLLADISGTPLEPSEDDKDSAMEMARQMMTDPKLRPDYAKYPNEMMAYLAGMVAQSNCMLVDELSDLKMYVVNRLVQEVETAKDSKSRIAALSKLGEVDGVDAFKKRSEVTMQIKPIEEVEKELLNVLDNIEYSVLPEKLSASEEDIEEHPHDNDRVDAQSENANADE